MKIPNYRRIFEKDYPSEFQTLVKILSVSINNGFEVLYEALNRKLSLTDNIQCTIRDVDVTVDANGIPTDRSSFKLDVTGKVVGAMVLRAENQVNSAIYPTNGVFINFTQSDTDLVIDHVTGLQSGQKYRLKIVAFV